jgi:hypothetical protein
METIVRRRATKRVVIPDVQLDIVLFNAAEVRVVATGSYRSNVVLGSPHRTCDQGVHAVRADDDAGVFLDGPAVPSMTSNADDHVAGHEQLVDREALAYVHLGFRRCVHEEVIEHCAAWTEAAHAIVRVRNRAAKGERADIERHSAADGRNACRGESRQESPPCEDLSAVRPQNVG